MGKCSWTGFVQTVKLVITFIFSHIGLCAFVAGYSVAGAFLFKTLEQEYVEVGYNASASRNHSFERIYEISEHVGEELNASHWKDVLDSSEWRTQVLEQLEVFEDTLVRAVRDQTYDQSTEAKRERWNVIGSLFYCVTVITTIGYGNLSPRSPNGKLVTIVYALFGIPLMLLCLSNIGNSMATSFRFMYHRMCCWYCRKKREEKEESESSTNLQKPSGTAAGVASGAPYTPPPKYKPNRRNMIISPPISATIHRGSDNPLKVPDFEITTTASGPTATSASRPAQTHLLLPDQDANRIVAECAAYTKTHIPGFVVSLGPSANDCHDYDMVTLSTPLSSSVSPRPSPSHSPRPTPEPSSPRTRDGPEMWRENGGPHIIIEADVEQPPSNYSTRPGSPAFTTSTHHASNMSLTASNLRTLSPFVGGVGSSYGVDVDDPPRPRVVERPPRSPGKTLVVYNTLSGDALLEQSKIARKMALMNKGGFGQIRTDATTVFTDPISGQAVDGDMLGLNYRPIPPDNSDAENRVPIPIVLAFVASYLGIGALLFVWLEDWPLLDSFYFCFITLSTIGFGDFVPANSLGNETQEAQIKLVTGSIYLLFGLAVLAMSFDLVQEEVVLKCKAFAHWIGLLKD